MWMQEATRFGQAMCLFDKASNVLHTCRLYVLCDESLSTLFYLFHAKQTANQIFTCLLKVSAVANVEDISNNSKVYTYFTLWYMYYLSVLANILLFIKDSF